MMRKNYYSRLLIVENSRIFRFRSPQKSLGFSDFVCRNEILLLGNVLKFRVIFQKIKKFIEKILFRKKETFQKFFNFLSGTMAKIRNIIWIGYKGRFKGQSPRMRKSFQGIY